MKTELQMYITVIEAAFRWKITPQSLRDSCYSGNIAGAKQVAGLWMIPETTQKPFQSAHCVRAYRDSFNKRETYV